MQHPLIFSKFSFLTHLSTFLFTSIKLFYFLIYFLSLSNSILMSIITLQYMTKYFIVFTCSLVNLILSKLLWVVVLRIFVLYLKLLEILYCNHLISRKVLHSRYLNLFLINILLAKKSWWCIFGYRAEFVLWRMMISYNLFPNGLLQRRMSCWSIIFISTLGLGTNLLLECLWWFNWWRN